MGTVVPFPKQWDPWVTKRQLARVTGFSVSYLEKRMREGMPSTMRGNRRMFRVSEAEAWLATYLEEKHDRPA